MRRLGAVAKAVRTEGKQAPFSFVLPFNPSDIQPNASVVFLPERGHHR